MGRFILPTETRAFTTVLEKPKKKKKMGAGVKLTSWTNEKPTSHTMKTEKMKKVCLEFSKRDRYINKGLEIISLQLSGCCFVKPSPQGQTLMTGQRPHLQER